MGFWMNHGQAPGIGSATETWSDEATSALDVPTEREALESVANFRTHQTIIVISHRLRSLAWVDRFVLLDHGRIAAVGAHSVLYEQSALYRSLSDASVQE
jgi:ABC-type multidrug transport system fused ATPase/permease subunit